MPSSFLAMQILLCFLFQICVDVEHAKCSICLNIWHDVVTAAPCLHNFWYGSLPFLPLFLVVILLCFYFMDFYLNFCMTLQQWLLLRVVKEITGKTFSRTLSSMQSSCSIRWKESLPACHCRGKFYAGAFHRH